MKTKEPTETWLKGALSKLSWTKVSRRQAPSVSASAKRDIVYGIRSTEDIVKARAKPPKNGL